MTDQIKDLERGGPSLEEEKGEPLSQQRDNLDRRIADFKKSVEDLKNPETPVKANNTIITESYNSNITEQIAQMARQNRVLGDIARQSIQNQEVITEKYNKLSDFIEIPVQILFC